MSGERLVTRVFTFDETPTEISLESCFWDALRESARNRGVTTGKLISTVMEVHGSQGTTAVGVLRAFLILDAMDPTTSLSRTTTAWHPPDASNHDFGDVGSRPGLRSRRARPAKSPAKDHCPAARPAR